MAWKAIDRISPVVPKDALPVLSEAVRAKIRSFFPRYETKRAALLPALHVVQASLGHVGYQAMMEVAELLEIPPSAVLDTVSFYTHFWTHPKGRKVITICRSITCQFLGGEKVFEAVRDHLGIGEHETTADGEYSLMTEECLAGCDHAPCLLINEKLHKRVRPSEAAVLLKDPYNGRLDIPRSDLFDPPPENGESKEDGLGTTSDVAEMEASD